MPETAPVKSNQQLSKLSLAELSARLEEAKGLLSDLSPERKMTLDKVLGRLQTLGLLVTKTLNSHGSVDKCKIIDPITLQSVVLSFEARVKENSPIPTQNYGEFKRYLNSVAADWGTKKTALEAAEDKAVEISKSTLHDRITKALDIESHGVLLEITRSDEGVFFAHFALKEVPYLHWSREIPSTISNGNGIFNQAAFNSNFPQMKAEFNSNLGEARNILEDLAHYEDKYATHVTYDDGADTITIHQNQLDEHRKVEIKNVSLADLHKSIDDQLEYILFAAEEKISAEKRSAADAQVAAQAKIDTLKTALKNKCEGEGGLGLTCTIEGNVAQITSPELSTRAELGPVRVVQFRKRVSLDDSAALEALIGGGLKREYKEFRTNEGAALPSTSSAGQSAGDEDAADNRGFKPSRFPKIPAQSGQSVLRLADATDMQAVRDAMLKLQAIDFSSGDEGALEHFSSNSVDHATVKNVLMRALMAIGKDRQQLEEDIKGLGPLSPLLSQENGITKAAALRGLSGLLFGGDVSVKTSITRGFTHMKDVYPDDVRSLLHVLDGFAAMKADRIEVEKIKVELDKGIVPKGLGVKPLKRAWGGGDRLGPEKTRFEPPREPNQTLMRPIGTPALIPTPSVPPVQAPAAPAAVGGNGQADDTKKQEAPVAPDEMSAGIPAAAAVVMAGLAASGSDYAVVSGRVTESGPEVAAQPEKPAPAEPEAVLPPEEKPEPAVAYVAPKPDKPAPAAPEALPSQAAPAAPKKSESPERTTVMPPKELPRTEETQEESNGRAPVPSHQRFGRLVKEHRIERDMTEKQLAQAIRDKAGSTRIKLDEEVTEKVVKDWEAFRSVPVQSTFALIKKVLIDDNKKIPDAEKEKAAKNLGVAYRAALLARKNITDRNAGEEDFVAADEFKEKIRELRTQVGLTDNAAFAEAIHKAAGPNISEKLEDIDWRFVSEMEDGKKPSLALKDVILDALRVDESQRKELEESYSGTFAARVTKRTAPQKNGAEPQNSADKESIEEAFKAVKKELRAFFDPNTSNSEVCRKAFPDDDKLRSHHNNIATIIFGDSTISAYSIETMRERLEQLGGLIKRTKLEAYNAVCEKYIDRYSRMKDLLDNVPAFTAAVGQRPVPQTSHEFSSTEMAVREGFRQAKKNLRAFFDPDKAIGQICLEAFGKGDDDHRDYRNWATYLLGDSSVSSFSRETALEKFEQLGALVKEEDKVAYEAACKEYSNAHKLMDALPNKRVPEVKRT